MSASHFRPPTVTPLTLLHEYEIVDTIVAVPEHEAEPSRFDIAPRGRPQDAIASFTIAAGLIHLELHEPEQVTLDIRLDVERRLPPIAIAVRRGPHVDPIRLLGHDWGGRLRRPVWVRSGGTPQLPFLTIGAAALGTWTLEEHDCELSWSSGARLCSLRLSVERTGSQLILRPSCCGEP